MKRFTPICVVFCICSCVNRAQTLPKYQLKVGQEIQYEKRDVQKFDGRAGSGQFDTETKATFWVVRALPDGGWRLVIRQSQLSKDSRFKGGEKPQVVYGAFDLKPDGHLSFDPQVAYALNPATYFPRLPSSQAELEHWTDHSDLTQTDTTFTAPKTQEVNLFTFSAKLSQITDEIYDISNQYTAKFDRERGLLTNIEAQVAQTYVFNGKGTGKLQLKSVEMKDLKWIEALGTETDQAFALVNAKWEPSDDAKVVQQRYQKLAGDLREVLAKMTLPETKRIVEERLAVLPARQASDVEDAKTKTQIKAAPPADWSTKDLDGKPFALKDLRGKVVLLDYWYRGCGWCIRAMPQIKQLADQYKDKGVVVLGMNTDTDLSDAKVVVDTMKLNYPVLQAKDLVDTYKVNNFGFPTVVIIDQNGIVRELHVGYTATLKSDLSKIIDGLLAKK